MVSRRLRGLFVTAFAVALWFGSQFAFGLLQAGKPELHPTTLLLEPASPVEQGRLVSAIAKLENTGSKAASAFKVEFFVRLRPGPGESAPSWKSFAVVELRGLSPEEQEIEVKGVLDTSNPELIPAPNVYEVRVVVDSNDQIPELDETNNELIVSLRVTPSKLGKPDLRPTTLTFEPPSPVSMQDTVLIATTVQNTGDRDASPFEVAFSYCFLPEGRTSCPTSFIELEGRPSLDGVLPKGSERRFTHELNIPALGLLPGHYLIKVTVDPPSPDQPAGRIEEQDEANNELVAALFIQGPELFPTSLRFEPALPRLGDAVKVTAIVKNAGVGTAHNVEVAFFVDGARFALTTITVEENQEVPAEGVLKTGAFNLGVGIHTVRVVVDPEDRIAERDETNNEIHTALTLQPPLPRRAELHPKRLVVNPSSPIEIDPERSLTVLAEIVNTGEIGAQGFEVAFFYRATGRVRWVPLPCTAHCTIQSLAPGSGATAQGELALADLEPGNYELLVVVDPDDRVPELDEENNTMRSSFTLLAARRPDLVLDPTRVRIEPSLQVQRGAAVRVRAVVTNAGEGPAEPFIVEFSWRRVEEEAFHTFARREIPGLALGEEIPIEAALDTTPLRPGLYELLITVDPEDRVAELDETNNVFSTGTSPEQAQPLFVRGPDLAVLGVRFADPTLSPLSPLVTQGEQVEIIAEITNLGVEAAGGFEVKFCRRPVTTEAAGAGGGEVPCQDFGERVRFPGLGVGVVVQARTVLNTRDLAPGSYEIFVNVDPVQQGFPFGQVEEENELNNTGFLSLGILPQPDLLISSVRFDPPSPVDPGTLVTVFAEILNAGEGPARKAFAVDLGLRRLGEEECPTFATDEVSGLAPGESTTVRAELPTVELGVGGFELCVTVDPDAVIPEADEGNNSAFATLAVGRPDLVIESITFDPARQVAFGQPLKLFADVRNVGEGPVIEPFEVEFAIRRLDPETQTKFEPIARVTLPGLEAGQQAAAKVELDTAKLPLGAYELRVTVDPEDAVRREFSERNNQLTARFAIGLPDLIIQSIAFDPTRQVPFGQELKLFADVRNVGEGPVLGSFIVEFAVRRVEPTEQPEFAVIARVELQDLAAGAQAAAKVELDTGQLAPGTYVLRVVVDPENVIPELDEGNNQLTARFAIGLPDLVVQGVTFDPVPPVAVGTPLKIFADVRNVGRGPALTTFAVEFALRRIDPTAQGQAPGAFVPIGRVTLPGLAAGAQAVAKLEIDTTQLVPGHYELRVIVDPANAIAELSEENNRLIVPLEIITEAAMNLPDLTVTELKLLPERARVRETVEIRAEIANIGGKDAGPFLVMFFYRRLGTDRLVNFAQVTFHQGLAAGERKLLTVKLDTSIPWRGQFEIIVRADASDQVEEADETNNEASKILEIY